MKRGIALLAIAGMLGSPVAVYAQTPSISHPGIACVASGGYTKIAATIPGAASARLYFSAVDETAQYFVEMLQDASGAWWAVLPIPAADTAAVTYRIVATGPNGEEATYQSPQVPVSANCGVPSMTSDEQQLAQNLVVGWLGGELDEIEGFRCESVDVQILPDGTTRRVDCPSGALVAAAPAGGGALAGLTAGETAVIIGGAIATVGAAAAAYENNRDDDEEVSPIRP